MEEEINKVLPPMEIVDHEEVTPKKKASNPAKSMEIIDTSFQADYDNVYEGLDVEDYKDYLGDDIFVPTGGVEAMNQQRAEMQPWYDQARNMIGQAVVGEIIGGTVEGLGYLLDIGSMADYMTGEETSWGNFMTDAGKYLREGIQEAAPIYQTNPGKFNPTDSGWWFGNGVSVASTLSMLIPSSAAGRVAGFLGKLASRGLGKIDDALDIAAKMGKQEKWMADGISQAIFSRHIENSMEASGTFESARQDYLGRINPETGVNFSEEEATKLASEAAASNYRAGWVMLLQDIPQYLAIGKIFNPNTMKMENALSKAAQKGKTINLKPWQQKVGTGLGTFASEGFEESYQYYIAERGKALSDLRAGLITKEEFDKTMSDAIGSDEMMTSAFFGGLGGNIFQAAGPAITNIFKSKTRKEQEKNAGIEYNKYMQDRAKAFTAMQIELGKIDQTEDGAKRQDVIDEMMLQVTLDALEMNRFDDHITTLKSMSRMSNEEKAKFKDDYGVEFNEDLISEYSPRILERSNSIRKAYFKNLNKFNPTIASAITKKEFTVKKFNDKVSTLKSEFNTLKREIPRINAISTTYSRKLDAKVDLRALQFIEKKYKNLLKNYKEGDDRYNNLTSLLKENKSKQDAAQKLIDDKGDDPRNAEEKAKDRKISEGYLNVLDELTQNTIDREMLDDAIFLYQKEISKLKTPTYQKEFRKNNIKNTINNASTLEDINKLKGFLSNSKDITDADRRDYESALNKREEELTNELNAKTASQRKKDNANNVSANADKTHNDNNQTVTDVNTAPISDNFEDEHADEEMDFEETESNNDDKATNEKVKAGKNIKLLDRVATPEFKEWLFNNKDKVGTKVELKIGDAVNDNARQAIEQFNSGKLDDFVFNHLPIKVEVADGVHTFIPAFTAKNRFFKTNELPKRTNIIKALKKGKVFSEVTNQFGGNLQLDNVVDGVIPENSILDLNQVNGKLDNIDIVLSNDKGQLIDTFKGIHSDYRGRVITLKGVLDDNGNSAAYKGGVFLNVKKANGRPFPLKLNLRKVNNMEANLIADLLIEVINKRMKLESPVADNKDLLDRLKNNHPEEYRLLGNTATVNDVVQFLVHMNPDTDGKAVKLKLSGNSIQYGTDSTFWINPENEGVNRAHFISFLTQKKRRQFNLNRWNDGNAYKNYMLKNNIMTTNAVVNKPLFTDKATFGLQKPFSSDIYIKQVELPKSTAKPPKTTESKASKDIASREAKSAKIGVSESFAGGISGIYIKPNGNKVEVSGRSKEAIETTIKKLYDKEKAKLPAQKVVKPVTLKNPITNDDSIDRIESDRKKEIDEKTNGLRSARKGDKGVFWTQFKGSRKDDEKDRYVEIGSVSKYGVKFKGDKSWTNFENYFYFRNETLIKEINEKYDKKLSSLKSTSKKSVTDADGNQLEVVSLQDMMRNSQKEMNDMHKNEEEFVEPTKKDTIKEVKPDIVDNDDVGLYDELCD